MPDNMISSTGVLSTLSGVISSFTEPTRNGRLYPEEEWKRALSDPILKEQFKNHMVLGELGHPQESEERLETLMERACINMPEPPVFDYDSGNLIGTVNVLDTPMGRIAEALRRAGCIFGISSRADGDVENDAVTGIPTVHNLSIQGWDLVALPAVEDARLHLVESFDSTKQKQLKESLQAVINDVDYKTQQIIVEQLDRIDTQLKEGINLKTIPDEDKLEDNKDIMLNENKNIEADVIGSLTKQLDEALAENAELRKTIKSLQEDLSVGHSQDKSKEDELSKYKQVAIKLSSGIKTLKTQVDSLQEQLENKNKEVLNTNHNLTKLNEQLRRTDANTSNLNEELKKKDQTINSLMQKIDKLSEDYSAQVNEHRHDLTSLKEELQSSKLNSKLIKEDCDKKINNANHLIEHYKNIAQESLNKYIESKATCYGLDANEIRNKLPKKCNLDTVDSLCEELRRYKVNMNALPFELSAKSNNVKVKTNSVINNTSKIVDDADDISDLTNWLN